MLALFLSAACASTALTLVYYFKSQNGAFFYMSNDITQVAIPQNLLQVILPAFFVAEGVSILIGLGIGFFFSRQVAIPVYKFQKWVEQLKKGNLKARISFREKEHMQDVTADCNALGVQYRETFARIKKNVELIGQSSVLDEAAKRALLDLQKELACFSD